jgi:hypothetical protein
MQGRLGRRIVSIALTALVIAQTQSGNLNAHNPPNLISITDRQICQDSKLFYGGHHPAGDAGKSVSRGGQQDPGRSMRALETGRRLRAMLAAGAVCAARDENPGGATTCAARGGCRRKSCRTTSQIFRAAT